MSTSAPNSYRTGPDETGKFGIYGGRFVAETLMPNILELEAAYATARKDPAYEAELNDFLEHYVGRPSPLDESGAPNGAATGISWPMSFTLASAPMR